METVLSNNLCLLEATISASESTSTSSPLQNEINSLENDNSRKWEVDLLYDSECPLCMMEVKFLQKRDTENKIRFTDLSSPDYNPAEHGNVQFADGMRKIRAVLPDNTVVVGVEVFRRTYEAIGLGWIFHMTNFPVIGKVADSLYDLWAENRLRITGRGDLADLIRTRAKQIDDIGEVECNEDACGIDYDTNI